MSQHHTFKHVHVSMHVVVGLAQQKAQECNADSTHSLHESIAVTIPALSVCSKRWTTVESVPRIAADRETRISTAALCMHESADCSCMHESADCSWNITY